MKGLGGTGSQGKKSGKKNMIHCRRCGNRSYHIRKSACASCGFGKATKLRRYSWKKSNK